MDHLPPDIITRVACCLSDPASLAATCRTTSRLLDQDALLLTWAAAHLPEATLGTARKHPGYALLHWRRLRCMPTPRLVALLLKWMAPGDAAARSSAQQLLHCGDALGALQALLPHSEHLLLPCAAQVGQLQLLGELLAVPGVHKPLELRWNGGSSYVISNPAGAAMHAAAHCDQAAALQLLLQAFESTGKVSDAAMGVLESAAMGGSRSEACVVLLAQQGADCVAADRLDKRINLLSMVAASGHAAAVSALLPLPGYGCDQQALVAAMCHSQLHLLPLLRPSDMDDCRAAFWVCSACGTVSSGDAGVLALLPRAVQQMLQDPYQRQNTLVNSGSAIHEAMRTLLSSSTFIPTLAAVWESLPAPADKSALALIIWEALRDMLCQPDVQAVEWAVQHAPPSLISQDGRAKYEHCRAAVALCALKQDDTALLQMLQEEAAIAALISSDEDWQQAQRVGQLRCAVRKGNVPAVQAARQAVQQNPQLEDWLVLWEVLADAAALSDPAAAAAVVAALAPHPPDVHDMIVHDPFLPDSVFPAHSGRLLAILCERNVAIHDLLVGEHAVGALCLQALQKGCIEAAEWLVRHDSQRADYLSNVCEENELFLQTEQGAFASGFKPAAAAGLTALLHKLAAPSVGSMNGVRAHQHQQQQQQGSRGSDVAEELHGSHGRQPPAGARQLDVHFVRRVLGRGYPDPVHALLVYMDSWGLRCSHTSSGDA